MAAHQGLIYQFFKHSSFHMDRLMKHGVVENLDND